MMTAGGRRYFTEAYVTLRVIREHVASDIPIEVGELSIAQLLHAGQVFYLGPDELPESALQHMHTTFRNVRCGPSVIRRP